jgi:hypothetical protein
VQKRLDIWDRTIFAATRCICSKTGNWLTARTQWNIAINAVLAPLDSQHHALAIDIAGLRSGRPKAKDHRDL